MNFAVSLSTTAGSRGLMIGVIALRRLFSGVDLNSPTVRSYCLAVFRGMSDALKNFVAIEYNYLFGRSQVSTTLVMTSQVATEFKQVLEFPTFIFAIIVAAVVAVPYCQGLLIL